ncbi:unnamed protein product [Ceutorhynchus assimilis]|uniref:Peptidase S1 domain-containing protein n=1 Tax=Ceutorhynchus assimilis TaxID=467358 RepID=A0A9N9MNT8_9CUCU|nr:unnamed protein product [Ceutorhynchus assimilis]
MNQSILFTFLLIKFQLVLLEELCYVNKARMIGGRPCPTKQFNFVLQLQGTLQDGKMSKCAAYLIEPTWALTAAHCKTPGATDFQIIAPASTEPINVTVKKFHIHPKWKNDTIDTKLLNDIALLKLDKPLDDKSGFVTLPSADTSKRYCKEGLGTTVGFRQERILELMCGNLKLMGFTVCQDKLKNIVINRKHHICSFSPYLQMEQCDSGGPLFCANVLVGLGTFLPRTKDKPAVYTKVQNHLKFIRQLVDSAEFDTSRSIDFSHSKTVYGCFVFNLVVFVFF